jgi:gliding motility-associated-like protein
MGKSNGFLLLCLLGLIEHLSAQNPYVLNGSATQDNCHCYTLTTEQFSESGSIWNKNKIDLSQPFNYFFNVFLGCRDLDGADGIAFVLQPVSTSLGSSGQGLGFGGIVPSLGVTIDTYQNTNDNDPVFDHIGIQANGDVNHLSPNNLAGPVQALTNSDNIEDCNWHILEINWQPADSSMQVSMDGVLRLTLQKNIIASIFNNDPKVFWGFTSATGGSVNLQKMCTSLDANFVLGNEDSTCVGTPITFVDSSVSFGSVSQWYWNFGDGTTSTLQHPPPYIYAAPGIYNASLNIVGGDGCVSDTFKNTVTVGSMPRADFQLNTSPLCSNTSAVFTDATTVDVGNTNYWYWNFGNDSTSNLQNPSPVNYTTGNYTVELFVKTKQGCISDTVKKTYTVNQAPLIDFMQQNACKAAPVSFAAKNLNAINIQQWFWNFGDGSLANDSSVSHVYADTGIYALSLAAKAINGCVADTVIKPVTVYSTNAYAGKDTTIFQGYPYQLQAKGGYSYMWSPSTGLNNAFIANPVTTLNDDITYVLTAYAPAGCATTDTLNLKIVKGPQIYVPSAFTPNGDGRNDRFKIVPVGIAEINFKIMNRWGQTVYSSKGALDGWDGMLNGNPQTAGTYVWMIIAKALDGTIIKKQGTLVLIR